MVFIAASTVPKHCFIELYLFSCGFLAQDATENGLPIGWHLSINLGRSPVEPGEIEQYRHGLILREVERLDLPPVKGLQHRPPRRTFDDHPTCGRAGRGCARRMKSYICRSPLSTARQRAAPAISAPAECALLLPPREAPPMQPVRYALRHARASNYRRPPLSTIRSRSCARPKEEPPTTSSHGPP